MLRRTWIAIPALAVGVLLALLAGAQDSRDTQSSLDELLQADGMTREQMAARMLEALEEAELAPPDCVLGEEMFDDVPASSPFCPFVEELARRGITSGCGGNNFCPTATITREQMAVFVVGALATKGAGSNSAPGYGSGGTFNELRTVTVDVGPSSRPVFIVGSNEFWGPGTTCFARIRLEWQGVQQDTTLATQIAPPSLETNNFGTVMTQAMPVLPGGTHEIKLHGAYFDGCFSQNSKLAAIVLDD